jgi:alanine racemase
MPTNHVLGTSIESGDLCVESVFAAGSLPHASGRAEVTVDLDALRHNVDVMKQHVGGAQLMAVVKANAYGHGLVPCARAFREAGVPWLATAVPDEALVLRRSGDRGRLLTWLWTPQGPFAEAVAADIDISVSGRWDLNKVVQAARSCERRARVHLKVDTGLGRNGCGVQTWADLVSAALRAQDAGAIAVVGLWSHLATADEPGHPSIPQQSVLFHDALDIAECAGAEPEVRHLANSAAALLLPETHYDLVRVGLALYGLSPAPNRVTAGSLGLRPAMTLRSYLAAVKEVPAEQGVSYGLEYRTRTESTLGLVPLGYSDGVPWQAGNSGQVEVQVAGRRRAIAGRIAMDQFVIDLHGDRPRPGDEVVVFGPGDRGEPTVQEWARAAGTIPYELLARTAPGLPRTYVDSAVRSGTPTRRGVAGRMRKR